MPGLRLQLIDWAFFFFLRMKTESLTIIPLHESGIKSLRALITNSGQLFPPHLTGIMVLLMNIAFLETQKGGEV